MSEIDLGAPNDHNNQPLSEEDMDPNEAPFWGPLGAEALRTMQIEQPKERAADHPDGGQLVYRDAGPRYGLPLVLLHGIPGAGETVVRELELFSSGIRLITYDRPGFGKSTRRPGRPIATSAQDVEAIANHLGINEFTVVGRSGGGPHALAVASGLGNRVLRVATFASTAPREEVGDEVWFSNMTEDNKNKYLQSIENPDKLAAEVRDHVKKSKQDPRYFFETLKPDLTKADLAIINTLGLRPLLVSSYKRAFLQSGAGWYDSIRQGGEKWGFDLAGIKAPVAIWHGANDPFVNYRHAEWLSNLIPDARLFTASHASHFNSFSALMDSIQWLKGSASDQKLKHDLLETDDQFGRYITGKLDHEKMMYMEKLWRGTYVSNDKPKSKGDREYSSLEAWGKAF